MFNCSHEHETAIILFSFSRTQNISLVRRRKLQGDIKVHSTQRPECLRTRLQQVIEAKSRVWKARLPRTKVAGGTEKIIETVFLSFQIGFKSCRRRFSVVQHQEDVLGIDDDWGRWTMNEGVVDPFVGPVMLAQGPER